LRVGVFRGGATRLWDFFSLHLYGGGGGKRRRRRGLHKKKGENAEEEKNRVPITRWVFKRKSGETGAKR